MALLDVVIAKVKDDSGRLSPEADYLPAIDAALQEYSEDRPLVRVVDLVADGTTDLALPVDWEPESSQVQVVEWPIGPEGVLPREFWMLYIGPGGEVLRLLVAPLPDGGEAVRVRYTVPRTEGTVAAKDVDAVANLAAAICSETLASLFTQTSDPTISADVVNYRSKSSEFAARAKRLRQLYQDHFGLGLSGGPGPAMAMAAPPLSNRGRLTH